MSDSRLSAEKRALALWTRAWQLAGHRWPPASRAILRQILTMWARAAVDVAEGTLDSADAFTLTREAVSDWTGRQVQTDAEHQAVVDALIDMLLDAEFGAGPPDGWFDA